jgi:hypothetical protein
MSGKRAVSKLAELLAADRQAQADWVAEHESAPGPMTRPISKWLIMERLKNRDSFHKSNDGHVASLYTLMDINISRELTRFNVEGTFKLIEALPLTEGQKNSLYLHIDMIVSTLLFAEDDIILSYHSVNKREEHNTKMLDMRDGLKSVIASRRRRDAMRSIVEEIDKEFCDLPARKRVSAIEKALLKREDFAGMLPKNLKDPRFIKADIESILFPPSEPCEEPLGDVGYEDEMTGEPLDQLLRDLGVDPDEAI